MPPRALAKELGLARGTIDNAYALLTAEGFMKAEHSQMLLLEENPGALLDALERWQAPVVTKWIEPATR